MSSPRAGGLGDDGLANTGPATGAAAYGGLDDDGLANAGTGNGTPRRGP